MEVFNLADVDPDETKYWMLHPKDARDLVQITNVGSIDYNASKVIYNGGIDFYCGFNIFWSNRITTDTASSASYRNLVWVPSGLILGQAEGITSRITERADKNYAMQVYSEMSIGALRLDGDKVHECLTDVTA